MPDLQRVRELTLMLAIADPQGAVARGLNPFRAYGVEAHCLAMLEEQHTQLTQAMVVAVMDFWYEPLPGWPQPSPATLKAFFNVLTQSRVAPGDIVLD